MWRYLVLNSLWFSILFLVHFFGTKSSRHFVLFLIFAGAFYTLGRGDVDPFAWFFYVAFSFLVFRSAGQFKRWALAGAVTLEEELGVLTKRLDAESLELKRTNKAVEAIGREAEEISYLCGKIKEMSQTLDPLEAFFVFGEAVSRHFRFDTMRLVLSGEEASERVYCLAWADLRGFLGRSVLLGDRKKTAGELSPADRTVLKVLAQERRPLFKESEAAYPVLINHRMAAALFVTGLGVKDAPIFSILSQSFFTEIQRLRLFERVQFLTVTDGLTGVAARRRLLERLEGELDRSKRQSLKLSFLMIDVDDFKHFNDSYGHLVGDGVLRGVAATIRQSIREVDLAGRYGGEEFGVLLTETDESGGLFVAERIRRAVAEKSFRAYGEDLRVTVSIGCSTYSPSTSSVASLMEAADAALYEAKRQGKNRVQLATMEVQ